MTEKSYTFPVKDTSLDSTASYFADMLLDKTELESWLLYCQL